MIDSSLWYTDLNSVRKAIDGLSYLVRYSKREYLDDWINNGNLQIRNAISYATDKSIDRQDWETMRSYLMGKYSSENQKAISIPAPSMDHPTNKIDVRPVSVEAVYSCPDYWMFSMSKSLCSDLLRRFGGSCCVVIGTPESLWTKFLSEVAEQLGSKRFNFLLLDGTKLENQTLPLKLATMDSVEYLGSPENLDPSSIDWQTWLTQVGEGDEVEQIFKKPASYAHQDEVKFAWAHFNFGDLKQHSHRWRWTMEDVKTGERHQLVEVVENEESEYWVYDLRLPSVMVQVTPPPQVIKLTLEGSA